MAAEPRESKVGRIVVDAWRNAASPLVFRSSVVSRVVADLLRAYPGSVFRYGDNADRDAVCEVPDFDFAVRHAGDIESTRLIRDLSACPSIRTHGHGKLPLPPATLSVSCDELAATWSFFSVLDIRTGIETDDELRVLITGAFRDVAKQLGSSMWALESGSSRERALSLCTEIVERTLYASHAARRKLFEVVYLGVVNRSRPGRDKGTLIILFWLPRSSSRDFVVKRRRRVIHHFCSCVLGSGLGASVKSRLVRAYDTEKPIQVELTFKLVGLGDRDVVQKLSEL